ncbi:MAG: ZIP family metal transporter [Mariniblastus sp.]|nr:ZIP family metal transporter [Mariniblastus sp.]
MSLILIIYCCLIATCSALGGSASAFFKLTHQRIQYILSLVSGVMLGVAFLHLLPHSIVVLDSVKLALGICLFGLLFMFFLIRVFHFHQHDLRYEEEHDYQKKQSLDADDHHVQGGQHQSKFDCSWLGLCFGLAVHTLIDGIALASAVTSETSNFWYPAGLSVFLAIILHKPLDALSITSLMAAKGWSPTKQMTVNVIFALMCPLGAILFTMTVNQFVESRELILGIALAFSAGIFLYISLGDLLPEVHFHAHHRLKLSAMLIIGILVALGIELLPGHAHLDSETKEVENSELITPPPNRIKD